MNIYLNGSKKIVTRNTLLLALMMTGVLPIAGCEIGEREQKLCFYLTKYQTIIEEDDTRLDK